MTGMHPSLETAFSIVREKLNLKSRNIDDLLEASKTVKFKTIRSLRHEIAKIENPEVFAMVGLVFREMIKKIPDETYNHLGPKILATSLGRARYNPEEKMKKREEEILRKFEEAKAQTEQEEPKAPQTASSRSPKGLRKQNHYLEQQFGVPQGGIAAERQRPPLAIHKRRNELAIAHMIVKHARASSCPPDIEPLMNLILKGDSEKARYKLSYDKKSDLNRDMNLLRADALKLLIQIGKRWPSVLTEDLCQQMTAVRDNEMKIANGKIGLLGLEVNKLLAVQEENKSLITVEAQPEAPTPLEQKTKALDSTQNEPAAQSLRPRIRNAGHYKGLRGLPVRMIKCNKAQREAWASLADQQQNRGPESKENPRAVFKKTSNTNVKPQHNAPRRILGAKFRCNDPALMR